MLGDFIQKSRFLVLLEKTEDVTRQRVCPHTEIISCSFSLVKDVLSICQVTTLHVWILEVLYLATHVLVFLEDIHHFWCIKGSENFLSKYFCFILFKNFLPMYLIMEVFSSPFWEVQFQIILCIHDFRFYSEVYRRKSVANVLLGT